MTITGNIFLFLATIAFVAINNIIRKSPPGTDAAVGYFWGIILLSLVFLGCMIVVVIITGTKGGYAWISPQPFVRVLAVSAGLICTVAAMALSALFKYETGPVPFLLRLLSGFAPLLIPLLLVVAHFVLMNRFAAVPPFVYKFPLIVTVCLGIAGTASAAWSWMKQANRNQTARVNEAVQREQDNHQRMLDEIDSCDVMKNMVFILVLTDANQDTDVKTKAVAKVKTHPHWQDELIIRLQNDWAPEVFYFLASNEVDNPALFPEAIRAGVLIQAKLIRERIRKSSYSYPEEFYSEIDRVIRTVDKYNKKGTDYLPPLKELRAAIDEPSSFDKPAYACIPLLDKWIRKQ